MAIPKMRFFSAATSYAILLLLTLITFSSIPNIASEAALLGNETDKLALLEFKSKITEDPQGVFSFWNGSLHFCNWVGVKCAQEHQRIASLDLQGRNLAGTMSPAIGNLSFLRALDLGDNSFRGEIPSELGHLFRLRSLNLSFNLFGGEIPANLSGCSNLLNLSLHHNYLIGDIPFELGSLSNLMMLDLKSNNLTGSVPASIGNLTSLQSLALSSNNLKGQVPESMSQMRSLTLLSLSSNSLSGVFPPPIYNLSSLEYLGLSYNNYTGNLPANTGLLFPHIQYFSLAQNYFTGPIPVSLTNASELLRLDVPYNSLAGKVPEDFGNLQNLWWFNILFNRLGSGAPDDLSFLTSLTNCSQLQFLGISRNQFQGLFPSSVTNLSTQMTRLLMGGNGFRGNIPGGISNLVNLFYVGLWGNFLTGKIPDSIGKLSNLNRLDLGSNRLSGEIPSSFGNNTGLLVIVLSNNSLGGSIPLSLRNCQNLEILDFSQNEFNGTLPRQVLGLSSLLIVNVSHNSFTGPLPEEIGNLTNLYSLDVSNNKLSGEIPGELGNCLSMQFLFLQGNSLAGAIPSLSRLTSVQALDLSHNNLSGKIPQYLVKISSLLYLNLSYNNLEGEVLAQGVLKNASAIDVSGNTGLCGGIQALHLHPCPLKSPEKEPKKHKISFELILVMAIVGLLLALVVVPLFIFFWVKKRKSNPQTSAVVGHSHPKISYNDLLIATTGFSSSNLIGSGNFGTVYKGILGPDQAVVAIKVLNLQQRGASKSFIAECQALRNIRHRNLVKILTACSSINFQGNDFKALVYEYMPNGSLENWLHPEEGQLPQQRRTLSILQRINIAIDVASALDYLHNQCQTPVVHCDIKPSNVLLDNELIAHVGDFGLAQLLCKFNKEANMDHFSSLGIVGTIGYAAPEYGMGAKVSTLGDVYSWGILLLELFTGRRPTDASFKDNLNLNTFVKMALPSQVMEIVNVDPAMHENIEEASDDHPRLADLRSGQLMSKCLVSVLQIGVACSSESPEERLNMGQVARELLSIRENFLRAGVAEEHQNQRLEIGPSSS